ncbi:amidohydrolase [Methylobacterium persicinum]|uniref:Amidohydrolase YtcJ n=1 Tax=Methylobacterium persicinum TaxID=374426 RepID=A0ABU0HMA1_9HYPH|nr:amidohydrolase [Methylobacterium persicinum]MDQ0443454.1 putative amidohydrolase YtcJ [Methylobacterium persicinum]GJE38622.1 N-substituted formamide deformylase [Methylobacterium persicinum]
MCFACSPFAGALADAVSRRVLLKHAFAGVASAGLAGVTRRFVCSPAEAASEGADTLFSGGPIVTIDDARPTAEAILVRGGRIVAVGARADVERQASGPVRTVDLQGKALLPGFVDPHGHVVMVGLQALAANLLPAPDGAGNDIPALQRILRDWIVGNSRIIDRYGVIIGFGYDDSQLREQRHPTRADLDAVSSDVPIVIVHQSGHLGSLNGKALDRVGVTRDTPDPPGGAFRRGADGATPNGVCEEAAFFTAISTLLGRLDRQAYLDMIKAGAAFYASFGYTTVQEGRAMPGSATMLAQAGEAGLLDVDVVVYPDVFQSLKEAAPSRDYTHHVRIGGVKATIDGSPQGKTAFLSQPYYKPPDGKGPDYRGYAAITKEQIVGAVDLAFANGWQILTHANGDAAVDWLIEAVAAGTAKHGPGDRRAVLDHGQTTRLDQLPKLKELAILPSFFPMHTYYWGDWHRDSVLGPERAARISPCRSARTLGLIFTTHHDAPVANPDSIRVLSATVTRVTRSGHVLGPEERVDTLTALKAMTLWPAIQYFEEADKGTITPGKLADFVVLSENPLAVKPEDLITLKVVETIKEGKSIHRST